MEGSSKNNGEERKELMSANQTIISKTCLLAKAPFLFGLMGLGICLGGCPVSSTFSSAPPNVLFILVDDLGAMDLSCYGSSFHKTPNIDRLAAAGIRFTQAYSASPVCSPTRAALLTGRYPTRLNITDWIPGQNPKGTLWLGPQDADQLALAETSLAEVLKSHAYRTFFAGKWHLGGEGFFPEDQGFDINLGGNHRGSPPGGYYSPYKNPQLIDGPEDEYLPDRLTGEAIQFLQQDNDNPFLIYLSYYTVHTPIQASKRHISDWEFAASRLPPSDSLNRKEGKGISRLRQDRADYASMVAALDENIGRLLEALQQSGKADNTLIVFTSDNGGLSTLRPGRNPPTSNAPLRAGKGWCYEGGIRIPLIIKPLQKGKEGQTNATPCISMDLWPTIMGELNIQTTDSILLDGYDLFGDDIPQRALFWHFPHYHGSMWEPGSALRLGNWKYIRFYTEDREELYQLQEDPGEKNELSRVFPEQLQSMRHILDSCLNETGAKFPVLR